MFKINGREFEVKRWVTIEGLFCIGITSNNSDKSDVYHFTKSGEAVSFERNLTTALRFVSELQWWQVERPLKDEAADTTVCKHCGQPFNMHKGIAPGEPVEKMRPCPGNGPFPLTQLGDAQDNYRLFHDRVSKWWADKGTVFEP